MKKLYLFLLLGCIHTSFLQSQISWSSKISLGTNTSELGVADFDQDGQVDIAVAGATQRWYKGPDFQTSYVLGTSDGGPYAARVADINADGWPDFVSSDGARNSGDIPGEIYVYLNPGASGNVMGNWQRITVYSGNVRHQNDMRIADMDGDGRLDIVERTWSSERVVVALQNANINSWTVRAFDTGENGKPEGVSAGDVDGDGEQEIILSGVYWDNPGGWRSGNPIEYPIDANFIKEEVKSAVGDIDNDGDNDVYMGSAEGAFVYLAWYENLGINPDGSVNFNKHIIKDNFGKCHMVELIDIDKDGDLDLCTGQSFGETGCLIFYNNNNGDTWTEQDFDPSGGFYTGIIADLDQDGDLDAVGPMKFYGGGSYYYLNQSPQDPPEAPENLNLSLLEGKSISLSWDDQADNEASYEIQRKVGNTPYQNLIILAANTASFTDENTSANTEYRYRVRAVNISGNSNWIESQQIRTWDRAGLVSINPQSGNYVNPPNISISAQQAYDEIRYTLDGSSPDKNSQLYSAPFLLTNSAQIKAIAIGNQLLDSEIATATYQVAVNGNFPPQADAGEDQRQLDLSMLILDASKSTDLDDAYSSLNFSWRQLSGPIVSLNQANTDRADFIPPSSGNFRFELSVSDESLTDLDTVEISVAEFDEFLQAYWPLDENSGNTAKEAIQSYDASLHSGVSWLAGGGIIDGCLSFDGNTGRAEIPPFDIEGEAISISCWIHVPDLSQVEGRIISKAEGVQADDHYWMLSQNGGSALRFRLKTDVGGTATLISPTGELQANNWYFVTAVYDGQEMRIYKDANKIAALAKTGSISSSTSTPIAIGNQPFIGGDRPFKGLIDDVRIYNKALTETEIQDLFLEGSITFPVEWGFFRADKIGREAQLNWRTLSESNTAYFSVERSPDPGILFQEIGRISARGDIGQETDYQFRDREPLIGKNYYRLRQLDLDQTFRFSEVRELVFEAGSAFDLFPNPAREVLNIYSEQENLAEYRILDPLGRVLIRKPYQQGFSLLPIPDLAPGSYFLQLVSKEEEIAATTKFIKSIK
ncbi:MAG: LamG-like jellyroll fold domain-containing protein [Bacteroidota bacterium]